MNKDRLEGIQVMLKIVGILFLLTLIFAIFKNL
jgi:hypothetical protein